jgi:hypothetical protein
MSELIQFGFDAWNTEYSWWCPNTVPQDFKINGEKQLPATHGIQWFDIAVFKDWETDRREAFNYPVLKNDFLYQHGNVAYSHVPKLAGEKYIFPVLIRDTFYFTAMKDVGFDYVSEQVMTDVREGRAKIVLIFPLEGTSGDTHFKGDYGIIDSWCKKYSLTKNQVYYIHGNHRGAELSEGMDFTYIPIDSFYCWVPGLRQHTARYEPSTQRNLYLSYNRRPRPHRTLLLCELIRAQILNRGLVSYYGNNVKDSLDRVRLYNRPGLEPEARILDSFIPMEIDMDLGENNPAWNIVEEHYKQTFLSLVPETLYDNDVIFFSEKIWKTIAVGHPFMLVSSRGMLKKLRDEGYYTFGSFWDESYDNIVGLGDRIRHITLELKRLSKLSPEQLSDMRVKMEPIVKHNQDLFNSRWHDRCGQHPDRQLYRIVETIWNSF